MKKRRNNIDVELPDGTFVSKIEESKNGYYYKIIFPQRGGLKQISLMQALDYDTLQKSRLQFIYQYSQEKGGTPYLFVEYTRPKIK